MKLTKHSIERMKERANITSNQISFFRNALRYGKSIAEINDEILKQRLQSRIKYNCKIKYYKGYVFIYSKNSKRLYTMYKLEEL